MEFSREPSHQEEDSPGQETFPIPQCIPVFPLPNVVFFPKTFLPLHIFEPRYRWMVADAAAQGQCIGMVLLKEGWEEDYYLNPPVVPIGCVGRLVANEKLADGRSNILLQGLERFEIREEVGDKSYRLADIVLKPLEIGTGVEASLQTTFKEIFEEHFHHQADQNLWERLFLRDATEEVLINTLSAYLNFTLIERQFLLEAESLHQRAWRLLDLIRLKRHEPGTVKGWG